MELSLVIPTRGRVPSLLSLLDRLDALADGPFETVLVVDADDAETLAVDRGPKVVVPPGLTMGALNQAGCDAARGEFVMLLNDDVVPRTRHWDAKLLRAARRFPDGVVMVHADDMLMKRHLCVFPLLPRGLVRIPSAYKRYRIDDHLQHVFDILGALGEKRRVWLPEVVFEHLNGVAMPGGAREYHAEPLALAEDARTFDALEGERRETALELMARILRRRIDALPDAFALRQEPVPGLMQRLARCWRERGLLGLVEAAAKRLMR
ncbi:MAG: glycosyltransferase family 2 protein [Gemmataceae bacterium]|nr:glycosyltransferase family 2 protein [Gemmataceae bacterium]